MDYEKYLNKFDVNRDFNEKYIVEIENKYNIKLPIDYLEFMKKCNGGNGEIGKSCIRFKSIDRIVDFNEDYEVQEYLPGYIMVADDGGYETFGIYYHDGGYEYIMVPFLLDEDAIISQGTKFEQLLERCYNQQLFNTTVDD